MSSVNSVLLGCLQSLNFSHANQGHPIVVGQVKEINFGDSAVILKMLMQLRTKSQQKMTKLLLSYKWKMFEKGRSIFSSFLLERE
jgi:hypothetical protein